MKMHAVKRKFLLIAGYADSVISFRGNLIRALQSHGFLVHVVAPGLSRDSSSRKNLEQMGVIAHDIQLERAGLNLVSDLRSFVMLTFLISRVSPDVVLSYTVKPVIYGSLGSWLCRVPKRYALITGLGFAFQGEGKRNFLKRVVSSLYASALSKVHKTFFQNPDDELLFRSASIIASSMPSYVVNGSGVGVSEFSVVPQPVGAPRFLLIARLLGDKGVREYATAAAEVKRKYPEVNFSLVGWIDENPDSISRAELDAWVAAGTIEFLGRLSDVRPAIEASNVYVLPSYREGTPRTVLEAMAMGRAVITTDAPGCRETVVHESNGFLVPVRSTAALVEAMLRFVEQPELISQMGKRARKMAEEKYDVHEVNRVMLREMNIQ